MKDIRIIEISASESLPCEQLVSPTPNERETTASNCLLFHRACASSSRPTWCIWRQFHLFVRTVCKTLFKKNANFSPKLSTKEWSRLSSKYYLVCGQNLKPKFEAFLLSLVRDCWARWTQYPKQQQDYNWDNTIEDGFKRLDASLLKTEAHSKH